MKDDEEMTALLVFEEIQEKIARGHQRQLAELTIVTHVVHDDDTGENEGSGTGTETGGSGSGQGGSSGDNSSTMPGEGD